MGCMMIEFIYLFLMKTKLKWVLLFSDAAYARWVRS